MLNREETSDQILKSLSELMGVPINYRPLQEDQGKVVPEYDINSIISKMLAFFVYNGLNVPINFAPAYNRVHADVEWWKRYMEDPKAEEAPAQEGAIQDGTGQPQ